MSEEKRILRREEVPEEYTWDLTDFYASDEDFEKDLNRTDEYIEKLKAFKGKLGNSAKDLFDYLKMSDEVEEWMQEVANYASRKNDQDTGNGKYQDYNARMSSALVKIYGAASFATPEILEISDEKLEQFYKDEPGLELYRRALNKDRALKDHILSAEMENLLAMTGEMAMAPDNIYGMLNNADMKFEDATDSEGKKHEITHGSFIPLLESGDRELRKSAFQQFYKSYDQFQNTAAAILSAQVKSLMFNAQARHYNSTLEASVSSVEVPTTVYHNLINAVHENMDKMYKYVELRKKTLGLDELHFYDIYTPITGESDRKVPYDEAVELIMEAVKPLGEDYCKVMREGFNNRWVDRYENVGKRSGAYSAGTKVHPVVLMNYHDTMDSMFTLIHEMGHSLHTYLSYKNQPTVYANYTIFVAEVASTCNEALLMQYLLGKTEDKKERAVLINHFLEQFRGTLYRQTMFAEFELMMNEMSERGETMTAEALCQKYGELQKLYFGDGIVVDDEIKLEWARIPHFFYNFYVYQYATSFSAAMAISQKILKEGEPAVKKYLEFLSGGCSKDPISLLKDAGVDLTTAAPINEALALFGELIDEMEELLK